MWTPERQPPQPSSNTLGHQDNVCPAAPPCGRACFRTSTWTGAKSCTDGAELFGNPWTHLAPGHLVAALGVQGFDVEYTCARTETRATRAHAHVRTRVRAHTYTHTCTRAHTGKRTTLLKKNNEFHTCRPLDEQTQTFDTHLCKMQRETCESQLLDSHTFGAGTNLSKSLLWHVQ